MTDEVEPSLSRLLVASMRTSNGIISLIAIFLFVILAWTVVDLDTTPTSPFSDDIEYSDVQRVIVYYLASIGTVVSCQVMTVILILQRLWPLPNHSDGVAAATSPVEKFLVRCGHQIIAGKLLSAYLAWDIVVAFLIPPSLCGDQCMAGVVSSVIMWALPSSATTALMVIATMVAAKYTNTRQYAPSEGVFPIQWAQRLGKIYQWASKATFGKWAQGIYVAAILFQLIMAVLYGMHWLVMRTADINIAMYSSEIGYIAGFLVVLAAGYVVLGPSLLSFSVLVIGQSVQVYVDWKACHQMELLDDDSGAGDDDAGNQSNDGDAHSDRLHSTAVTDSVVLAVYAVGLCLQLLDQRSRKNAALSMEVPNEQSRLM